MNATGTIPGQPPPAVVGPGKPPRAVVGPGQPSAVVGAGYPWSTICYHGTTTGGSTGGEAPLPP
jgi:hypothetical protein